MKYNNIKIYAMLESLESLGQQDKERYKYKMNKYKNECGCTMGGIFSIFALFISIFYNFIFFENFSLFKILKVILWSIVITIIAGLIGKVIGILLARIRLLLLYRILTQNFNKKHQQYGNM